MFRKLISDVSGTFRRSRATAKKYGPATLSNRPPKSVSTKSVLCQSQKVMTKKLSYLRIVGTFLLVFYFLYVSHPSTYVHPTDARSSLRSLSVRPTDGLII